MKRIKEIFAKINEFEEEQRLNVIASRLQLETAATVLKWVTGELSDRECRLILDSVDRLSGPIA